MHLEWRIAFACIHGISCYLFFFCFLSWTLGPFIPSYPHFSSHLICDWHGVANCAVHNCNANRSSSEGATGRVDGGSSEGRRVKARAFFGIRATRSPQLFVSPLDLSAKKKIDDFFLRKEPYFPLVFLDLIKKDWFFL
ncbi:hypothetical protein MUK42_37732 [Musa troglodytarum]|uniref:Uncharacterized protein n=1 Tax=Musa troglodytarum TaxID=320322 RepID=A0A9E7KXZ3_9LILI|nr:hypothetical protein MUK42_37732 [Musa troglodytarum]